MVIAFGSRSAEMPADPNPTSIVITSVTHDKRDVRIRRMRSSSVNVFDTGGNVHLTFRRLSHSSIAPAAGAASAEAGKPAVSFQRIVPYPLAGEEPSGSRQSLRMVGT